MSTLAYTHCVDPECGYPLRSGRRTILEAPGTRRHITDGLCVTCHGRRARAEAQAAAGIPEPKTSADEQDRIEAMRRHMREWHRPRLTARGITWDGDLTAIALGTVAA